MKVEGDRLVASTRFLTSILTGFAIFAALLAVFAIYGVTAYAAQQREREVAIRIALGATRSTVVRMFLKEGIIVLAFGIAFGLLGAAAVARMLESQLYGVQPFDASTLAAAAGLLTAAALLAAWRPAKRAAAKDPLEALKEI
ncbi:MAG: FtsX-like permease family protein [Acidobacteria bacterium]|nr:FtsX-like permease family protein [Acidobacteriota bacterium]